MLTEKQIGALLSITATARQRGQGTLAIEVIDGAICNAKTYQNRKTSIKLVATVVAEAHNLEDGAADAFDWVAVTTAQIARELRGGQSR